MWLIKLIFYFTIILIAFGNKVHSQDVHFSQRLAADKQRNAAFTNDFEGNWQAMTVYRQQWSTIGEPFTTSTLFFTKQFYSPIPNLNYFGGLQLTYDKSGDAQLTSTQFTLNLGASYQLDKNLFTFAVSNGFVLKSFNQNGLTFPEQYDRNIGGFNENLASGENFNAQDLNYYDLGFGGTWERELNDKWSLTSGFSMAHLTEPQESFYDSDNRKNLGYGLQFVAEHLLNPSINLYPYLSFYRAKGASETILGSAILFNTSTFGPIENIKPFLYVRTGIDRLSDALIVGSYADLGNFQLGASYDINISELELASNYQGGLELSLIYTAKNKELEQRRIPCIRY